MKTPLEIDHSLLCHHKANLNVLLLIPSSANKLFDADHYKRFWITVRSNGAARWQPGGVFAIACALDMNFYPFDDQKCTIEIETWVYTSDKVNLTNSQDQVCITRKGIVKVAIVQQTSQYEKCKILLSNSARRHCQIFSLRKVIQEK